jgi:type I restriction enzyme S subunit
MPAVEYEDVEAGRGALATSFTFKEGKSGIRFEPGDVLYGKLRPYLGNRLKPDFRGVAVGDWWVLAPSSVASSFLFSLIQSPWFVTVANQSSGSKMPRADWKLVGSAAFGVPSLPEQRRIGEFFSAIDNLIAAAERQEALLRQKKQAYLQLMFPQDGETEPRLRFQEFSDSWERHQLGEVIRPIKVIPVSRYPVIQQGDHPIAGYSSDEPYFQYSNVVLFGDHTLSLYRPESPFLLASDGLKVLSCDFPGNDFLYAMLERYKPSSEGYKRHFSILKKQHCSFPSLPEQRHIGRFFSTLDNLIAAAEQRAESLRALKSVYLQRMFA